MEPCRVFGRLLDPELPGQAGCSSLLSATRLPLLSSGWGGDEKEVNNFSYLKQVNYPRK